MFLVLFLILISSSDCAQDKCEICKEMTDKFREGMERTSGHNFGGGNTDWEERRLGSFADSETRLVDIMENVCSKPECHFLVEEHEEDIETWWFKEKSKSVELESWLCVDTIKVCCPKGKFGPNCEDCPGGISTPCLGHGKCQGDGSRSGSGECECDEGYSGNICDECDEGFYQDSNNTSELSCLKCHDSCDGECTDGSPKGCETCKDGWEDTEENGCIDKNECQLNDSCDDSTKYCVNTPGSFKCEACDKSCEENCLGEGPKGCIACKTGYEMTAEEGCKDRDECENEELCRGENEICENEAGSYSCKCSTGYKKEAGKCVKEEGSASESDDVTEDDVTEDDVTDDDVTEDDEELDEDIDEDEDIDDEENDDADLDNVMHEEL